MSIDPIPTVKFTNPITKQEITVFVSQVFAITYMPTNLCTALTSVGGAAVPVDVSPAEAERIIKEAIMQSLQELTPANSSEDKDNGELR